MQTLGELRIREYGGGVDEKSDSLVVVLMHGFGAPGDDLVPLAEAMRLPQTVRYIFPEAPEEAGLGGRAWWQLDPSRIERMMRNQAPMDLSGEDPAGMQKAREMIVRFLDEVETHFAPGEKIVLGGFSQGAMLACDVAFSTDRPLAGLLLFSGGLIATDRWASGMHARKRLSVFQSHGESDPILSYAMAKRLRDRMQEHLLDVRWISFQGGHGIPPVVLYDAARFLKECARV